MGEQQAMGHRQRATAWIRWAVLLGVCSAGFGVGLPGRVMDGERAIAATSALTSWRFNTDRQQLEVVLPGGATPRYFLLAQPARIVVDIPAVDAGASAGEQTFGGAVSRVRVAQFEPGLTRIVLELSPNAELAPGQVELSRAETLASGEIRWTLRPLLVGMTPNPSPSNDVAANSTPIPSSPPTEAVPALTAPETVATLNSPTDSTPVPNSAVPMDVVTSPTDIAPSPGASVESAPEIAATTSPEPSDFPIPQPSTPPVESMTSPVPVAPQSDPGMAISEDTGATVTVPPPGGANPGVGVAIAEDSPTSITIPSLEPAPSSPELAVEAMPESGPPMDMAISEDNAIALNVPPPSAMPAPTPSSPESSEQAVITEPPRLLDEAPDPGSQGADSLEPEPASTPDMPTELGDETLTSTFPDAVEIPIDFPTPTISGNETHSPETPSRISTLPSTDSDSAPSIVVPPLGSPAQRMEPEVATAPTRPNVLIPAGETLRLRYPRPSSLELSDRPWQEVLVLTNPVQDGQGTELVPAGTQVIGRFERDGRGYRFIAQAIALHDTILMLQGASATFRDNSIEPNTVIELNVDQDLMRSPAP